MITWWMWTIIGVVIMWWFIGVRIVRPTQKATIERLGRYRRISRPGFNWIIPYIDRIVYQDITERMMDIAPFEAITLERLNTKVDLVVYYKVRDDEKSVFKSLYRVRDFEVQIVRLAQTTARNIIGGMNFEGVNSKRDLLNNKLKETLDKESDAWGVEIVRVETKEITPPKNVQESMNEVLMAENEKTAAINRATAAETIADGERRAAIKEAEGVAKGKTIVADAEAYRIKIVNESANKYFRGNAQRLKRYEVTQASLENNSKIIVTEKGINPQIILGNIPIENNSN